jgi:hypothetical protein
MKWYHNTGLNEFKIIVVDEVLLSSYQKIRETCRDNPEFQKNMPLLGNYLDEKEYQRRNNVFLTPHKDHEAGKRNDVILGFEINLEPNLGQLLISPKISLDALVDVGTKKDCFKTVEKTLKTVHNGKYRDIPLYSI